MTGLWQQIIVFAVVLGAVAWLVTDRLRRRRAASKCDGCGLAKAVGIAPAGNRRPR
jgi:hypothetical protein